MLLPERLTLRVFFFQVAPSDSLPGISDLSKLSVFITLEMYCQIAFRKGCANWHQQHWVLA